MSILAIILGVFILFGIVFNSGLGSIFYTLPLTISGLSLVSVGMIGINSKNKERQFNLAVISFVAYLPIFIQLFTLSRGIAWLAIMFNIFILFHIGLLVNYYKPNKAIKKDV